ncbi:MAG: WD40 repeat domain-containing protein [Humidesulfovibrio sp.]|uniref:electron transfer complex subunit TmcD n=1 Tax=Humidesulfovibrio sp. TaxID=2910988 RepID=UPI0027FEA870|nr:WD40 repeat domain-containing protein [Humidesulfovibrio sp.]MDQ7834639.1 WD40 repeat domain-containing protein [Humidesulfovibrio sp.]
MHPPTLWNWEPGQRVILPSVKCPETCAWIEEPHASPDGERLAMLASLADGGFTALVNGEPWENSFDKAWYPRFSPDGRLTAVVQADGMWTLAVDGEAWEESFDYLWGTQFSAEGDVIAACIQSGGEYGLCLDGTTWETLYENANQPTLSADGQSSAAVVQVGSLKPADLDDFAAGVFGVAVNGQSWGVSFMNVWTPTFDPAGKRVAAQVRTSLYDYSIVVDGNKWAANYGCVWEPRFNPATGSVVAPVRMAGAWGLAQDDQIIWEPKFAQCWHQVISQDGKNIAAIVAPQFGAFTVAVNGKPWAISQPVVTDLVVARQGETVAALGNTFNKDWRVMVDGRFWDGTWDMAWTPVISATGGHVAVKVEKAGRQTLVVDGRVYPREFTKVFEPAFSPDGTKLLIRALDKDAFLRIVAEVGRA